MQTWVPKFFYMFSLSQKNPDVYKLSLRLIEEVNKATKEFPEEELYVLVAPIRRAAIPAGNNITEGASGISKKGKKRYYEISASSLAEADTQPEIAIILAYFQKEQTHEPEQYPESTSRMLSKMTGNLNPTPTRHQPNPFTR
jgi:four helix bundle protein